MDYRALAELIWFSFLGVSVFALVTGFSVRLFLAPVVREVLAALGQGRADEQARLEARLELVEHRLESVETEIRQVGAAEDFYRSLRAGGGAPGEDRGGVGHPGDGTDSGPGTTGADAGSRTP